MLIFMTQASGDSTFSLTLPHSKITTYDGDKLRRDDAENLIYK